MSEENKQLGSSYDARQVEREWYPKWEKAQIFAASASETTQAGKKPYVIMMPPPNVTGALHNGHALFATLQDILIRFHRMKGFNALWLPGIDHAGIATQTVVERELKRLENKNRHDLGRKAFIERIWQWKDKHGSRIVEQLKLMGASADWDRLRFTMDEGCSAAVREAFVRLWNEGLIYRGERLVNWDPASKTALSNEEVDHVEREGILWRFAYKLREDPSLELVVATTRPETMLGDVAVAVHPEDDRYKALIGKTLLHPFFPERQVVVIADAFVDPAFGTGAVKITPAHDPNDFAMGQRHQLPMITILQLDGTINENGAHFAGLDRFEARTQVKKTLTDLGLFRGEEKITHAVNVSQRSGADIEPMLSRQYFVNTKPLAQKAYEAVQSGETRIIPVQWKKTWDHFLLNIQDWCISRQLWWGHQIPVFYDTQKMLTTLESVSQAGRKSFAYEAHGKGEALAQVLKLALSELSEEEVRTFSVASTEDLAAKDARYIQEEDVLDTWFSSALWPFSTLGWPNNTDDLKAFYPGAVLETGFDILFFWVARMVMFGVHFMGKAPFADVFLHAMVRDAHGRKMSKSLGNAIDPVDVIEGISLEDLLAKIRTYPVPEKNLSKVLEGVQSDYPEGIPASGADGLRLSLAMLSGQGRDVKLSIPRVAGYRAFLNKVWNATRFALMRVGDPPVQSVSVVKGDMTIADRWIMSRLQQVVQAVDIAISNYKFEEAASSVYHFFWTEFCDWYIECAKLSIEKEATRSVLLEVLDTSMRLFHPICPFISEEIWQKLPTTEKRFKSQGIDFCAHAPFPEFDATWLDKSAEDQMALLQNAIVMIRNARQESGIAVHKKMAAAICVEDKSVLPFLTAYSDVVRRMATLSSCAFYCRGDFIIPQTALINASASLDVALLLDENVDTGAEVERLQRELVKVEKEAAGLKGRLFNAGFIAKAPPVVVEESKAQLAALENKETQLKEALKRLAR